MGQIQWLECDLSVHFLYIQQVPKIFGRKGQIVLIWFGFFEAGLLCSFAGLELTGIRLSLLELKVWGQAGFKTCKHKPS